LVADVKKKASSQLDKVIKEKLRHRSTEARASGLSLREQRE